MAAKTSPQEIKRRLAAFDSTVDAEHPTGSVTLAAEKLGMPPTRLSRWLLNYGRRTKRAPLRTKEQCIEGLKAFISRHKGIPSRDEFNRHSDIRTIWKSHWLRWDEFLDAAGVINDPAKILMLDIETAPNRAYFWGKTWKVNINPEWIDADGYVLCWTAKWLGEKESIFHRIKNGNHKALLRPIHDLLSEAHAVVHYNGSSFDIPTLNKEFLVHGFVPPKPYKQVDLLLTMRAGFNFPNNKLDYICKTLSLGEKLRHEGPQLWMKCMENDPEAWAKMEEYNRRDVVLLEDLYRKLLPWIKKHPNISAITGLPVCPSCGSFDINDDGVYQADQLKYPLYRCGACGVPFKNNKTITPRGQRFSLTA